VQIKEDVATPILSRRSLYVIAAAVAAVFGLYLFDLTGMGLVSTDEPRYAAIGQAMAQSGDWISPRLWGQPWFEKPALLYWMTASAFKAGLGPDLAPRLPVALLSVAFLAFFWWRLKIEWDDRVAAYSTALLTTSAGWLAYSHVSITDLPLAAFFTAALLLSFRRDLTAAAACLALAALAKGLVPLVLFLPALPFCWRRIRVMPVLVFLVIALPWYILCSLRNPDFLHVFFVEHTFGRFSSDAMQHVQPWWFYFPVALLLLFPWFPLLAFIRISGWKDPRIQTLAGVAIFGFLFFSAALNKLPGYLLPLLPAACVLIGYGMAHSPRSRFAMAAPLALLGALPAVSAVLPGALGHGLRSTGIPWLELGLGVVLGLAAGLAGRFTLGVGAAIAAFAFIWFQISSFPAIDRTASARPLWSESHPRCVSNLPRSLVYGLNYYAGRALPDCSVLDPNGTRVVR
jgi:4-amino-4-deoxy-L-arabinose transferase-like glycosyltransferase